MTVYVCSFGDKYKRMRDTLERSVRAHMPSVQIVVEDIPAPEKLGPVPSNHQKFLYWAQFVERTEGKIILLDADMLVRRDLSTVFDGAEWDAAITERTNAPMPLNGGAVYLNDTEGSREFMRRWLKWEWEYVNNQHQYREWYRRYMGPNQTALGLLLENDHEGITIQVLPCAVWNACPDDYHDLSEARVIHYKGRMQDFALSDCEMKKVPDEFIEGVKLWRRNEAVG